MARDLKNQERRDRIRNATWRATPSSADGLTWDAILGNAITAAAALLVCVLPLLLCWALLRRPSHDHEADAALAEFLVQELVSNYPVLLPTNPPRPLLEQTPRHTGEPQDSTEGQQPVSD